VKALSASLRAIMVEKNQIQNKNEALRAEVVNLESTAEEQALQHEAKLRDISERSFEKYSPLGSCFEQNRAKFKRYRSVTKEYDNGNGRTFYSIPSRYEAFRWKNVVRI
jgi:hypothetical protein